MRELRFLEISDLGDNLEEQERSLSFDARQTWIQIQTSWIMLNYQHGLFFFFGNSQLLFPLLENSGQWQHQFVAVVVAQSLSRVWLFVTSWTVSHQASLSFTISQSLLKFMSTELVMPSNHLVLSCPPFLLPSIFPSIRVFSNELTLHQVVKVELQL